MPIKTGGSKSLLETSYEQNVVKYAICSRILVFVLQVSQLMSYLLSICGHAGIRVRDSFKDILSMHFNFTLICV